MALVLTIGLAALPYLGHPSDTDPLISTVSAGGSDVNNERGMLDLKNNSVNVQTRSAVPDFRTIWEASADGSFPMIGINGRYYRMLQSPASVSKQLLGASLGEIAEFTTEPALTGSNVMMSNVTASGTAVYPVSGMGETLVASEVNGTMRVFQRVSFNGSALVGKEKLKDTLQIAGHITMMELSDVGVITDSRTAEKLFGVLTGNATYESSGSVSGTQSLLIELDNGLTIQLMVKKDKLGACGVWSCPEFFEAFAEAVQ